MSELSSIQTILLAFYFAAWLVGFFFQFLVIRRLKAMARSGEKCPVIASEFLGVNSIGRSFRFLRFIFSSEVSRISDRDLQRNIRVMRFCVVVVAILMAVIAWAMF